ncbi:MAG: PEP-CTERM/exosortase system-associated acyltransferase [Pseudomonadales bacterium]|nr:PEP-CTERM/exosortase system-associated acyltransferase [Halioglobus sp.]MCP5129885.1 PEP-CTERM/exosortase system-associated acyltransferase [Pseudomonadales bacterium]
MNTTPKTYAEAFLTYFNVCLSTTEQERKDVSRIRYRVYCEEFGYESKDTFPDGLEHDAFDAQSTHCLVTHKASNTPAGCVRVVETLGNDPLPFEKFCASSLDRKFFENNPMPRENMCEVSRLAVDGMFRRRSGEQSTRFGGVHISDMTQQELRTFPLIAVSCFLAANIMADLSGRIYLFAMMEPFLPRLLKRSGINFTKIGENIDYHGLRAPYFVTTTEVKENVVPELAELYAAIHELIANDFRKLVPLG